MKTPEEIRKEIDERLENIQFISPNEPITPQGILRVLTQMETSTRDLENELGIGNKAITMWNPNLQYSKDDIVMYFKQETEQQHPDVDRREFVFILISMKDDNSSIPNYDLVNGIPDFTKTNWRLLNPMSYLLQDLIEMRNVVVEVFKKLLVEHVEEEHGLMGSVEIGNNLLRKDYSNLVSPWLLGNLSIGTNGNGDTYLRDNAKYQMKLNSNGVMEYAIKYSFETKANQQIYINDKRYYYEKSPIWDESDQTIFASKYTEDDLFSVNVNKHEVGLDELQTYTRDSIYLKIEEYLKGLLYEGNTETMRTTVHDRVQQILGQFQEQGEIFEYTVTIEDVSENDKRVRFGWKIYEDDSLFLAELLFKPQKIVFEKNTSATQIEYITFNNLRYGTNIFHSKIEFPTPFLNDEYMVFFDTYGNGEFAFGYDREDLQNKYEPTYDAVVSMPMMMNKTASGFDVVLPIHTYFNSLQKYNIGVPWNNVFTMQVIGKYR